MLWVPKKGVIRRQHSFGNTPSAFAIGTSVTTGGSSNTKGTAVELISSTNFDAYYVRVWAMGYGAAATTSQGCLDILIGAATESVLIADLLMGFCGHSNAAVGFGAKVWEFPLYIPAGSRLAAQAAGDRTSTPMRVGIELLGGDGYPPFRVGTEVTTYGITTVPAGTDVAAGYSGAEGGWVEITNSTSRAHFAFVPSFHPTDGDTTLTPGKIQFIDLGVGAATEEALIGSEHGFIFGYDTGELCFGPYNPTPVFQDVPSGSRLVARISMSGATDTGEPDMAIHAVS